MERTRTFTWQDPMPGAAKAMHMSGLEYLNAMSEGKIGLPPLLYTMDFTVEHEERGQAIFSFRPQEFHYNPIGTVHGGVITAILDSAMGCSLHSTLPAGTGYTTLELKVNFLKAVTIKTGELKAIGKIIHAGSRTSLIEAQLIDKAGTVYAHAVSTCMILNYSK
ncbi:MAG: PaaI family thioesterase [Flavipsychrobacter sp.]|nr:PaaI family thioesterase [Flavipsychrobacter sp.]